jgi:hypothetical protein
VSSVCHSKAYRLPSSLFCQRFRTNEETRCLPKKPAAPVIQGRGGLPSGLLYVDVSSVSCMFFIARVTSLDVDVDAGEETL